MSTLNPITGMLLAMLLIIITLLVNFIPSIIAFKKNHPDKLTILIVNALIPVLGFIIALVWALKSKDTEERKL